MFEDTPEEEYYVESILQRKKNKVCTVSQLLLKQKGVVSFLVKWADCEEVSWVDEPELEDYFGYDQVHRSLPFSLEITTHLHCRP